MPIRRRTLGRGARRRGLFLGGGLGYLVGKKRVEKKAKKEAEKEKNK